MLLVNQIYKGAQSKSGRGAATCGDSFEGSGPVDDQPTIDPYASIAKNRIDIIRHLADVL